MGIVIFVKHIKRRLRPLWSNSNNNQQDIGVALALYLVYPSKNDKIDEARK